MFYLHPESTTIIKAKEEFYENMLPIVLKRIDKINTLKEVDVGRIEAFFDIVINDELDSILIGNPIQLSTINDRLKHLINSCADINRGMKYVFNYDTFVEKHERQYDAYDLAKSLNINTCTYCNRNYTSTIITKAKKKITRPEFDHFFDKATNPLLAISFYNLIPSCSICNSRVKSSTQMSLEKHLHPYVDDNINDIKFSYQYSKDGLTDLKVKATASNSSKASNTLEVFALEEIYNAHTSELHDMLRIKQYFSDRYLETLSSGLLKNVSLSRDELYRIVFGTEYESKNFINRPFSKFKSDILKELGIIS